ncbi:uncharacterized protein PITG_13532 [Phytophthora infestans T30-4]|uniref:Dynein heavy chain linker domain-containing protein n=1 Tax=Phytophthora infestans (strain T30-4) TaxID=403677 RepID=D0NM74_PHYIT|nr:uncharacterized protein PITG_13532 [Phytophthora infestans T30-4]EEY60795.1 conserved hypothetical protein [Phytophthora infestans T30-4]|eukprot:XP_002899741.1 conserved hypothetical protein [Phytophthora infestans T30-4]
MDRLALEKEAFELHLESFEGDLAGTLFGMLQDARAKAHDVNARETGFGLPPTEYTSLLLKLEGDFGERASIAPVSAEVALILRERTEEFMAYLPKEYSLQKNLSAMIAEWGKVEFQTGPYRSTGTCLLRLRSTDDIVALLDGHLFKTQTMRGSSHLQLRGHYRKYAHRGASLYQC